VDTPRQVLRRFEIKYFDAIKYTSPPQWREMLSTWKNKGIQGIYRKSDEGQDADFIKMRMIWEADETMERGVSERDHPSTFLA
jgi:hypothetical protein